MGNLNQKKFSLNIKIMKKYFLLLLFISSLQFVFGQDPNFTQYYNNPLYLNPALCGATNAGRVVVGYRTQWPKVSQIKSEFISADYFIPLSGKKTAFGLGIMSLMDEAGQKVKLKTTNINIVGSIEKIIWNGMRIRGGVQYGYFTRRIGNDKSNLIYEDQLRSGGSSAEEIENFIGETNQYSDISVGTVLSGRSFWFGIAAHHLNSPKQSITTSIYSGDLVELNRKWTFHGGWETKIGGEDLRAFRIESMYMKQGPNEQLSAGFSYFHGLLMDTNKGRRTEKGYKSAADLTLILGAGLRAVPLIGMFDDPTVSWDAVTSQFGLEFDQVINRKDKDKNYNYTLAFVYSFDYNISSLDMNMAGAHEVTLTIRSKSRLFSRCQSEFRWDVRKNYPINRPYL